METYCIQDMRLLSFRTLFETALYFLKFIRSSRLRVLRYLFKALLLSLTAFSQDSFHQGTTLLPGINVYFPTYFSAAEVSMFVSWLMVWSMLSGNSVVRIWVFTSSENRIQLAFDIFHFVTFSVGWSFLSFMGIGKWSLSLRLSRVCQYKLVAVTGSHRLRLLQKICQLIRRSVCSHQCLIN